jgi:hypothetical protein
MGDAPCPAPATAGLQGKRAHLLLRDQFERHGFVSGLPILTAAEACAASACAATLVQASSALGRFLGRPRKR